MEVVEGFGGVAESVGLDVLDSQGVAVLGMSIGNSYFSGEKVREVLGFCRPRFESVLVMITDVIGVHTLMARGFTADRAERKARLDGNALRNRVGRGVSATRGADVRVLDWRQDVEGSEVYEASLAEVEGLYEGVDGFRSDVRGTTRHVLGGVEVSDDKVDVGVKYLLAELAFLSRSPEILGCERVAYVYHRDWDVFRRFVEGGYDGKTREGVGFLVVR